MPNTGCKHAKNPKDHSDFSQGPSLKHATSLRKAASFQASNEITTLTILIVGRSVAAKPVWVPISISSV